MFHASSGRITGYVTISAALFGEIDNFGDTEKRNIGVWF